ncbi:sugar phosphate isomerase/epimerase family protein [Roseicitreum antarcticum]|uniref:Sugar phosphate isomerase/epimerase n=1 Tax=Roseicitreum antarcticum TaxID=564137 RepID=A0A1H2YUP1_9RHOB|nr:sugar phosphate isomerase/epimerase family protein [Roseicitreum antarcticum]SDX08299.1 Sugar phosphate isomerase/epimerase [Roseicitreum antarcticum]
MPLPLLGAAVQLHHMDMLRDWLFDQNRPLEIQDFVSPQVIAGDTSEQIGAWQKMLAGHKGPRGIHGPFFGLDLSNPDAAIRAIVQQRLIKGIEIAAALEADVMVVHSPFNFWHVLNYTNYDTLRGALMQACADCLSPVLARAQTEGVTLALENIDDTSTKDRADLADLLDHPQFRLSVDTGHADLAHANYGAPPVVDFLTDAGNRLAHVHLQDVDGHADRHWHPGDGRINWRPVMRQLAACAPAPRMILEVRHNLHCLPQTAAMLEGLVD